jgi:hypothetical protein
MPSKALTPSQAGRLHNQVHHALLGVVDPQVTPRSNNVATLLREASHLEDIDHNQGNKGPQASKDHRVNKDHQGSKDHRASKDRQGIHSSRDPQSKAILPRARDISRGETLPIPNQVSSSSNNNNVNPPCRVNGEPPRDIRLKDIRLKDIRLKDIATWSSWPTRTT